MSDHDNRVHLRDIAKGIVATLPDMRTVNEGILQLAMLRPTWRGSIGSVLEKHARNNLSLIHI